MVLSEELWILASCFLRPMSRNSVLEELRFTKNYCILPLCNKRHTILTMANIQVRAKQLNIKTKPVIIQNNKIPHHLQCIITMYKATNQFQYQKLHLRSRKIRLNYMTT